MSARHAFVAAAFAAALAGTPAAAGAQCYADPPGLLAGQIEYIVSRWTADGSSVSATSDELAMLAVLDALAGLGQAKPAALLVETADTSKQLGASSRAAGSTSLVERPNPVKFLAMALEHGAVTRAQTGTLLTLSSSPYALIAWRQGDTDKTYAENDFFRRLGFSVGFDVQSENAPLEEIERGQLREISGRFRLTPDRSARSPEFLRMWEQEIRAAVAEHLLAVTSAVSAIFDDARFNPLRAAFEAEYRAKTAGVAEKDRLTGIILCSLESQIVQPVRSGRVTVTEADRAAARGAIARIVAAQPGLSAARARMAKYFEDAADKPQGSIALTHHRPAVGTAFSEYKAIFEQKTFSPMKLVLNGGVSVYHGPDAARHQETVRDVAFSAALELAGKSPFISDSAGRDRATLSLSARFERAREKNGVLQERPNFGVFQVKVDFPLSTGINLPISFTMGTTAESVSGEKKQWQRGMHFGLTVDSDKILALAKARALALVMQ